MCIRLCSSAGTSWIAAVPIPRNRSARSIVEWRLVPAMTLMGGAPFRPSRSTSHPHLGEHDVTRCCKAGEVRHLTAGDESERGGLGQAEQLLQPGAGDLLDDACRGHRERLSGVLIPGGREPVGGDRRRNRPADDEAEEASARARHQARISVAGKLLDDLEVARGLLGERASEGRPQLVDACLRPHWPLLERVEVVGSDLRRALEQVSGAHRREPIACLAPAELRG